MEPRLNISVT